MRSINSDVIARAFQTNPNLTFESVEAMCSAFDQTCIEWSLTLSGNFSFNRYNFSIGAPVTTGSLFNLPKKATRSWLKIRIPTSETDFDLSNHSNKFAGTLQTPSHNDIPGPRLQKIERFQRHNVEWFAVLQDFAEATAASSVYATETTEISESWLDEVDRAVARIEMLPVTRHQSQAGISGVVQSAWGNVPHIVQHWAPAHCDFHWGNITAPKLSIFDWEEIRMAPLGFDICTLLFYSFRRSDITEQLERRFAKTLVNHSAIVGLLSIAGTKLLNAEAMQLSEDDQKIIRANMRRLMQHIL